MRNKIKELRNARKLSQEKLAESVGITRPTLSNIEKGKCIPRGDFIVKAVKYFGIPVEQIFFDEYVIQE